jgi:2-hydroxychromene-2-carboxylate isomerase
MSAFEDPKKLYFFFDFISHNAYLAWTQIGSIASKHQLQLEPVPVLFAAQLQAYGQVGPAEVAPKRQWMMWNVLRKARQHGIPIAPPHSHPFNPLLPLRAICAAPPEYRIKLVDWLFYAAWGESQPVSEAAAVAAIVTGCGLNADELLAATQTEAVKARLRENTEAALAAGVFGVPTMIVQGLQGPELFWGFDDLNYLDMFLSGHDPLPADRSVFADWAQVRPSAERRK